jgi:hypothetical protein
MALTDLREESLPACRLAAELAGRLERPLALVGVERKEGGLVPGRLRPHRADPAPRDRDELLWEWLTTRGLSPGAVVLRVASLDQASRLAEARSSPLVVASDAREVRLGGVRGRSLGARLAAAAALPVAVVPGRAHARVALGREASDSAGLEASPPWP